MKEQVKKFLNEEQDPKAVEKITSKLSNLLMKNEEVGYIAVQKKPAITVFPDSIVLTNKRVIICKPKNLGLSMDFTDFSWDEIGATFLKENILGSEFSFSTKTDIQVSIDYIPKTQARKIVTYAKEQLDLLKLGATTQIIEQETAVDAVEEVETEEVTDFSELVPMPASVQETFTPNAELNFSDKMTEGLSQDALFEKLQAYKKLLDNGLILQGEYDAFKKEILSKM